jgi:predicted methyltransferase
MTRRRSILVAIVLAAVALAFVAQQGIATLRALTVIERERDTWQRPAEVLAPLALAPGRTVVDLGSGAGYFALKMAPRVGSSGRVFAVDLRRLSLTFLWVRATRQGYWNLDVIHGDPGEPRLPEGVVVDAVLIANTYHELTAPEPILRALARAMRPGARLVVVDRGPRGGENRATAASHHELTGAAAETEIGRHGFRMVSRDDRFIDRATDENVWWLLVFEKK